MKTTGLVAEIWKIDVIVSNAAANPSSDGIGILETKESVLDKL